MIERGGFIPAFVPAFTQTAVLLVAWASPAVGQTADEKHPRTIEIVSTVSKQETAERVAAALIETGYSIDRADATAIVPAPRQLKGWCQMHLRANLLGAGDQTRVILSATYDIESLSIKNEVAEAHRHGTKSVVWQEVETAAAAVRKAVTEPAAAANQ